MFRKRRLVQSGTVTIYQTPANSTDPDQLHILFRLVHRGSLTKRLVTSALVNIFDRIEFNGTTCKFASKFHSTTSVLMMAIFSQQFLHYSVNNL